MLIDGMWDQALDAMRSKELSKTRNGIEIMEAVLYDLKADASCRDVPNELCPRKRSRSASMLAK